MEMRLYIAVILLLFALPSFAAAYNSSLLLPNATASGGFYDSNNVAFIYTRPYYCTPLVMLRYLSTNVNRGE